MAEADPSQSRLYNALHLLSRARKQVVSSAFCHGLLVLLGHKILMRLGLTELSVKYELGWVLFRRRSRR